MLDYSHNAWLVAASLAVALMAGFTGLSITRGASALSERQRKIVVAFAAVALGGGIWSMHFVAMLGLQLPILFYYDALITLISALVAVLMVGLALLLLHFRPRTTRTIIGSGVIVGLGIVSMHYIGMAGMQLCRPIYGVVHVLASTLASVLLSVLAIWVAYDERTHRNILLGTVCFGVAVFTMHFIAILLTGFVPDESASVTGPMLSNQTLAMGVTIAAFLICSAFLLTGISFIGPEEETGKRPAAAPEDSGPQISTAIVGIPYEREGQTFFADQTSVAALRAEGHYTVLYLGPEKQFCPWSISEAEARLKPHGFLRCHRSYLINPRFVSSFERTKDKGQCFFDEVPALPKVPVSRSRLTLVRDALGL